MPGREPVFWVQYSWREKSDGIIGEELMNDAVDRTEARMGDRTATAGARDRGRLAEGRGDSITAHFPQRHLDHIKQSVAVEDAGDGVAYVEHEHAQPAMRFVRARAFFIGGLADASDGCERTVEQANDFTDDNFI